MDWCSAISSTTKCGKHSGAKHSDCCQSGCFSFSGLESIHVSKLITIQTLIHSVLLLSLDSSG